MHFKESNAKTIISVGRIYIFEELCFIVTICSTTYTYICIYKTSFEKSIVPQNSIRSHCFKDYNQNPVVLLFELFNLSWAKWSSVQWMAQILMLGPLATGT